MILKTRLEWASSSASDGLRKAKISFGSGVGRRLLAFSNLSSHEGLSLGPPHFTGGDISFYELDTDVQSVEAKDATTFAESYVIYEATTLAEGGECIAQGCFLPLHVSYEVGYEANGTEAVITPVIKICSLRQATVCASLTVDGFELLPSARIPLVEGVSETRLRPVKLVRPKKYWAKVGSSETLYRMELELLHGDLKPILDVRELVLWGV